VVPVRTYYRPMMALTSGTMEMCARALGIGMPCLTGRLARLFFMFEAHGPHETAWHEVTAMEPSRYGGRIRSCRTRGAPEPSSAGRQDPEL
jgi:hypothetical protein